MYIKTVFLFFALLVQVESANILAIYPIPSISHQVVFRKVTLELVKQGHQVTVITPDPAFPNKDGPQNLIEIDIHDISYSKIRKNLHEISKSSGNAGLSDIKVFVRMTMKLCDIQLQLPEVQEVIFNNKKQFDLILIEEFGRAYLAASHVMNAPVILFSSSGGLPTTFEVFGTQTHPILYPTIINNRVYNLSTVEKIYIFYRYISFIHEHRIILEEEDQMLRTHFGPEIPSLNELYKNVHMLFLNMHSIWVENQPVPPNIVFLGGLHELPTKELPQDLKNYLDSSKHGVIYVSFGTNALSNLLQTDKIRVIAKVLGQLPYDVLWKWDQDILPEQTKNIRLSKWLPQADLLKHPKIKLFITQAGLQSTDEAITAGVPLLAFPVLGDQWFNAEKYERFGIGMKYLFEEINEDIVKHAVETVISNKSYRENVIKLRELINDQPQKPLERAMFWINHIIRHKGGKHLLPAGANLTWTQYYEVEVILIVIATISVALTLFIFVAYYFYQFVRSNISKSKKNKAS